MKAKLIDNTGEFKSETSLDKDVFGFDTNENALLRYYRAYRANNRQGTSSTKTRAEVSGGGKKPWRQKGTGRARVGSSRNPIWRHGGISHGPKPRSYAITLPKSYKILALLSSVSQKAKAEAIAIIEDLNFEKNKTSKAAQMIKNLKFRKTLFVLDSTAGPSAKALRNIKNVFLTSVSKANAFDFINATHVVFTKSSLKKFVERFK